MHDNERASSVQKTYAFAFGKLKKAGVNTP